MSHYDTFMRWLLWPITAPLEWFFRHRCKLDADGCCLHEYCAEGKDGVVGWGQSNERWVRRNPLPPTPPKGPPPPRYK